MKKNIESYFNGFDKSITDYLKKPSGRANTFEQELGDTLVANAEIDYDRSNKDGVTVLKMEITCHLGTSTTPRASFEINQLTFDKLGLGKSDKLHLCFSGIELQGHRPNIEVINNCQKTGLIISVLNCKINALGFRGIFDELNIEESHFKKVEVTGTVKKIIFFENRALANVTNVGVRIHCDTIDLLGFRQNRGLNTIILIIKELQKSEFTANQIGSLGFKKGMIGDFLFNNNDFDRIELEELKPVSENHASLIEFKMSYWGGNVILKNLDFSKLAHYFNWSKFRFEQIPKMRLVLSENNFETVKLVNVNWHYNVINNEAGYKGFAKKDAILLLKGTYSKQNDAYFEKVFESYEKRWHHDNVTNFPLWLSWYSNEFGLSIVRPFLWLILFITIEIILLLGFRVDCSGLFIEEFGKFFYLLNPVHRTNEFLEVIKGTNCDSSQFRNWILGVDNIFRILIGYSIFQFINAFRYKHSLK